MVMLFGVLALLTLVLVNGMVVTHAMGGNYDSEDLYK